MCGIVGYVGPRACQDILVGGLRRLEYRGYDSAGIALLEDGDFAIRRASGKLSALETALKTNPARGNLGIGHTRWATHGRPSEENAHPHRAGDVVLVHNGIIENFLLLRQALKDDGCVFASETDTEVLSHLIDREVQSGLTLLAATRAALARVQGSYAIAVMSLREPDRIVVAKNASPLMIGLADGETMVASDIPAMLGFSKDMVALDDGEIGLVRAGSYEAFDLGTGEARTKKIIRVDMTPAMAEKGGFKHFMLKEIHEQPQAVIDTMRGRVSLEAGEVVFDEEGPSPDTLARVGRVHLAACGTSWHACLVARQVISALARIPVEVHLASEFDADVALLGDHDLFVAVTQSGETLDTLRALRQARDKGLPTLAVCNAVASTASRDARYVLYTHAGPEISVASTKAFITQIVLLHLLAIAMGRARDTLDRDVARAHINDLMAVPGLIDIVLQREAQIRAMAQKVMGYEHMLYLGRGLLYPVALEGALKLKEISYLHAEGYAAGEMKHGPIALIDERFPTLVVMPEGPGHDKVAGNLEEVRARGGRVFAVATDGDRSLDGRADDVIRIPAVPFLMSPLVATIPLQLLAYHVADLKGTDVDQPRNLAKSVTVE